MTERLALALGELPDERVLDLACGPGITTPSLAPNTRLVVGLGLTHTTLVLARAGQNAGIALREEDGDLWFIYGWGLFVAEVP